jgi:hypothetical protein
MIQTQVSFSLLSRLRKLADYSTQLTITLRETNVTVTYPFEKSHVLGKKELTGDIQTVPAAPREHKIRNIVGKKLQFCLYVCINSTFVLTYWLFSHSRCDWRIWGFDEIPCCMRGANVPQPTVGTYALSVCAALVPSWLEGDCLWQVRNA